MIWFDTGDIVHATCEDLHGAPAVYRLLAWQGGTFRLDPGAPVPQRSIDTRWEELLLEGCRLLDEAAAAGAEPFPSFAEQRDATVLSRWEPVRAAVGAFEEPLAVVLSRTNGGGATLDGATAPGWESCVPPAIEIALRITGPSEHGVLECVGDGVAVGVLWDGDALLVVAQAIPTPARVQRFRSRLAALARGAIVVPAVSLTI